MQRGISLCCYLFVFLVIPSTSSSKAPSLISPSLSSVRKPCVTLHSPSSSSSTLSFAMQLFLSSHDCEFPTNDFSFICVCSALCALPNLLVLFHFVVHLGEREIYFDDGEGNGMYLRNTFVNNGLISRICIGSLKILAYYLRMLAHV